MRLARLSLALVLGLLLGAWSVLSYAETCVDGTCTQPATTMYYVTVVLSPSTKFATRQEVCVAVNSANKLYGPAFALDYPGASIGSCKNATYTYPTVSSGLGCPATYTLSGSSCVRPDCPVGQVRGAGDVCECPAGQENDGGTCKTACPSGYHRFVPDDGRCEKDCIGNQTQAANGTCKCTPSQNQIYSMTSDSGASPGCDGGCKTTSFLGTLYCPKSSSALVSVGALPAGTQCWGYGGRTGETCTPAAPPRVDVKLAPLPPPAPPETPTPPTPENPTPPPPDPKATPDNNKDPVACGAAGGTYMVVSGQGKCATPGADNGMDGVKAKATETVTINPDGTKTITTEKTVEVADPLTGQTSTKKMTTTVTKDSAGNTTGTGSSESSGSSETGDGEQPGQCAKEPDSPLCKKGVVPTKGQFSTEQEGKIEAKKAELRAKFAEVKASAQSMFAGNLGTGGGSLPCYPPIMVLGSSFSMCFTQFEGELSMIGLFIMLSAALGAAFIVLKR